MPSLGAAFSFKKKKQIKVKEFWIDYIEKRNMIAKELNQQFSEIDNLSLKEFFQVYMSMFDIKSKEINNAYS